MTRHDHQKINAASVERELSEAEIDAVVGGAISTFSLGPLHVAVGDGGLSVVLDGFGGVAICNGTVSVGRSGK